MDRGVLSRLFVVDAMTTEMTTGRLLLSAWDFEWSINLGSAAALCLYFWKIDAGRWQRILFAAGILVLVLSLESPLDPLGDDYLFSAHMAQHLLLILIVPPLLLLGISEPAARKLLRVSAIGKAERILGRPVVAWFAAIAVMTLWHVPVFYNFALAHEAVHVFQHLSFLVTATMFWWPVLHPIADRRLKPGVAVLYLFAAAAENSALGIILTFMRVGHYPAYLHPDDDYGALHLIRNVWQISPASDQRLGGLLMWIPGCSIYFIAILGILAHWYAQPDGDIELPRDLAEHHLGEAGGASVR
jgi:putative membrane protein